MDFFLFLLVNATLFIRPAELIPGIAGWPIYEVLMLTCATASAPKVLAQLDPQSLVVRPITACVVGLLFAVALSHLSHFFIWGARMSAFEFCKVLLYYLMLVGTVDSEKRLRIFLFALVCFSVVVAGLALLQYHGYIAIPSLNALQDWDYDAQGNRVTILRLVSTGIFGDPNDLSMILVLSTLICVHGLFDRKQVLRPLWLAPIALFGYAFALTQSRGGLLALLAGLFTLCNASYGWKKTFALGVVGVPVLLLLFGGRQTDFMGAVNEGTGHSRAELWSEGLQLFKQAPLFGVGHNMFNEEVGMVAHNSFFHCLAELGLFGGALFLGAFFTALVVLRRTVIHRDPVADSPMPRLAPYMLAILVAYGVSMLSLSRAYVAPTYMVLGLATAYMNVQSHAIRFPMPRFSAAMLQRFAGLGVAYVGATYLFIKVVAR